MKIYPHILLKKWDLIMLSPNSVAQVICLIDGRLRVQNWYNRFILPYWFYYKIDEWKNIFEPIIEEKH